MTVIIDYPLTVDPTVRYGIPQGVGARGGYPIAGVVLHQLGFTLEYYDALMNSSALRSQMVDGEHASMHFGIRADGAIHQYIDVANTAWAIYKLHNPTWPIVGSFPAVLPDYYTINIGFESNTITIDMRAAAAELLAYLNFTLSILINNNTVTAHYTLDDTYSQCFSAIPATLAAIIADAQAIIINGNFAPTATLFGAVYSKASQTVTIGSGSAQINAATKVYDDVPAHVSTPSSDWQFVAPITGLYAMQIRAATAKGQFTDVRASYSIDGGSNIDLIRFQTTFDVPEVVRLTKDQVVRFFLQNDSPYSQTFINIQLSVALVNGAYDGRSIVPSYNAAALPAISPDAYNQVTQHANGLYATQPIPFYPTAAAQVRQTACAIYAGSGAPSNVDGANGDIYFRSNGGALTTIYQRRAGAWVGIV